MRGCPRDWFPTALNGHFLSIWSSSACVLYWCGNGDWVFDRKFSSHLFMILEAVLVRFLAPRVEIDGHLWSTGEIIGTDSRSGRGVWSIELYGLANVGTQFVMYLP